MKKACTFFTSLAILLIACDGFAQQTYIPDDAFEAALIELGYDTGMLNDSVATDSIAGITELVLSEKGIADLTGIADFTALEILRVDKNELTTLDLSGNPNLIDANIGINDLTELDISQNPLLETINLQHNELTEFDISQNPNLKGLSLYRNNITQMDFSQNVNLEWFTLSATDITEIDVSNLVNLKDLSVYTTAVSEIDVSQNPLLETLNLFNTQITEVDVSQNPNLTFLNIRRTDVSELDVTNNPNIYNLYISEANLSDIDISNNPELHRFWIHENRFQYPELEAIFVADTYEQFKGNFEYAPQQWIGERIDTTIEEGLSIVFEMTDYRSGTMDTIRWYKDGELFAGQNTASLMLEDVAPGDAGDYYAVITSGVVPEIELQSNLFKLAVDPNTGFDYTQQLLFEVYPNPASEYIYLDAEKGEFSLRLFDQSGQCIKESIISQTEHFFVGDCPAGSYFLQVTGERGSSVIKLILE